MPSWYGPARLQRGNEGDPPVAGLEQIAGGLIGDVVHVHGHGVDVEPRRLAVQKDQRTAGIVNAP